jgi:hypothetical protein
VTPLALSLPRRVMRRSEHSNERRSMAYDDDVVGSMSIITPCPTYAHARRCSAFADSVAFSQTPTPTGSQPLSLGDQQQDLDADKLCAVCSDRAVCQHYGARTCEGCDIRQNNEITRFALQMQGIFQANRAEKSAICVRREQKLSDRQALSKSLPVLPIPKVLVRRHGEGR